MMTTCQHREEGLVALLYEDGDEAVLAEMRSHLATCSGCRAEFERLTTTRDLLGAWPNVTNAPRMVYVNEPLGFAGSVRRWVDEIGGLGLRALLRPLAPALAVVLVFVVSVALLDFRVSPDGSIQVGFGDRPAELGPMSDAATGGGPSESAAGITREEFNQGLAQAVGYLEELVQSSRQEDRQTFLTAMEQRLQEQDLAMSRQLSTTINAAFDQMERQRQTDLALVAGALDDLQFITTTEMQRIHTILASLLQQGAGPEKE